ncbi:MAG: ATP-dependent helicase [Pirellulales bacterium]
MQYNYSHGGQRLTDLLADLTDAQRQAVEHTDGALLILAGPGSGKTRVITHRIAWMLRQGIRPESILALTFTNKAAEEMRSRVANLAPGRNVWMSTFHRFCARSLRQYAEHVGLEPNFAIYDTSDSRTLLRQAMVFLKLEDSRFSSDQIAAGISWAKNNLISAQDYKPDFGNPLGAVVAQTYPLYQARLLKANAVDFDDLLLHTATLLRENPELRSRLDMRYRYIMVDEYQDTNLAQYTIVRGLSIDQPNLAVTGDPDQSIYGWRGANLRNILDFENDYPHVHVVRLEQNYRSTKRILRAAGQLIGNNRKRKVKELYTENSEGPPVRLTRHATQQTESEAIAARIAGEIRAGRRRPRDFAIFYRTNALSRVVEYGLRDLGIPYQMINGVEFYQRKEIKDVLSYLALLNNPRNEVALLRIINTPARAIGKTTIERLQGFAVDQKCSLLEAARQSGVVPGVTGRSAVAVAKFVALIDRLMLLSVRPVEEVLFHVLTESGYEDALRNSNAEEDQERLANIQELLSAARQFDERNPGLGHLEEFLEETSLVNDTDEWEANGDRVTLMTLHASKGLEFPVVFIMAVEQGLLPHERSKEDPDQLEEERRLLFVGMTRAREELHLSHAQQREFRGRRDWAVPSQFLFELPREEMTQEDELGGARLAEAMDEASQISPGGADDLPVWSRPGDISHSSGVNLPCSREPQAPASGTPASLPGLAALTTAAELHAEQSSSFAASQHDEFRVGTIVRHTEFGLGKIVSLSGGGARRCATVAFASQAGQRTFVLASAPLQAMRPG